MMVNQTGATHDRPDATSRAEAEAKAAFDNLGEAVARLRAAIERLSEEVEASAHTEWERAKPEVRQGIGELQTTVEELAMKARTALGDLSARLDNKKKSNLD